MTWDRRDARVLELPSGRRVRGRRLGDAPEETPAWGLYLSWRPPTVGWDHAWVRWPDFGLPVNLKATRRLVAEAWERSATEKVEIACPGGRGRTGTVLAALVMLDGLTADQAVAWVRRRYDRRAVETPWQRLWLARGQAAARRHARRRRRRAGTSRPSGVSRGA